MIRIDPSEITPEHVYLSRRKFMAGVGALAASSLVLSACGGALSPSKDAHDEKRPASGLRAAEALIEKAREMAPRLRPLAVECCSLVLDAERPRETLLLLGRLPPAIRVVGRIRVLEAVASFRADVVRRAREADGREGRHRHGQ